MENQRAIRQSVVTSGTGTGGGVSADTGVSSVVVLGMGAVATSAGIGQSDKLSDEKLFALCRQYGRNALEWRRKFLGLLPEVAKRKLYEKHGFSSIFEFAKKLAGVSEEQVRVVLNLEKRFEDKKELHELLVNGKVSVNKLSRVASVVNNENESFWAQQVKVLPQSAVNILVKDQKFIASDINVAKINRQNGLFEPKNEVKSLYVQTSDQFVLADDVEAELNKLHEKAIDVNDLLRKFLEKRKQEIEEEKEKIAQEMLERKIAGQSNIEFAERAARRLSESLSEAIGEDVIVQPLGSKSDDVALSKNPNRYVPRKIRKIIKKEFGTKCAVPTCNKLAAHLHHTLPFALSQNHDPRYLIPLCKEHHIIAHSVDQKFREVRKMVT